ncbi:MULTISPECIES: hypothetical protein [unclassified Streptomyces]|uniref:aromatic-ring hydroxylase C-terminal domain-containing protein n=1 Tax=unclassified Streptomyces TaxID=2593676 RepID=UPI0036E24467
MPDGRGALCVAPGANSHAGALTGRTDRVTPHRLPALPAAAVLVRPDGHVCWAADTDDTTGLEQALDRWFGAAERAACEQIASEQL